MDGQLSVCRWVYVDRGWGKGERVTNGTLLEDAWTCCNVQLRVISGASLYVVVQLDPTSNATCHPLDLRLLLCAPLAPCLCVPVQLDPHNSIVLSSHLLCAAKELPLLPGPDSALFGPRQLAAAATQLHKAGLLGKGPQDPVTLDPTLGFSHPSQASGFSVSGLEGLGFAALHYTGPVQNPASEISLRTIDPERFIIYNSAEDRVLEDIEANMAFYNIYDGAVYLYQVRGDPLVGVCVWGGCGMGEGVLGSRPCLMLTRGWGRGRVEALLGCTHWTRCLTRVLRTGCWRTLRPT